ncbi:hypothetical protein B296_00027526 [Ensete ventricosum]|uniref:Uncharacterized protein n=1 Tax=Ensete ventricosum TaxID=4639 RepID=A0A426YF00_ENSVE|nr:hypothetical protein B296_00027526 [Ensete ventricosum]
MSQEHSVPSNPLEDVPFMTQQTPGVAPQSLPPFPLFGEENPVVYTLMRYWRLFNDLGLTPPAPNFKSSVVTSKAFPGPGYSGDAPSNHPPHSVARVTVEFEPPSGSLGPNKGDVASRRATPSSSTSK